MNTSAQAQSRALRPAHPGAYGATARGADAQGEVDAVRRRGRGALSNRAGRHEPVSRAGDDDGWGILETLPRLETSVTPETPRSLITTNTSPDLSFDQSINPYRGCEHGCTYCYARPSHANMGLSPGLDFETKLFVKAGAAKLLEKELGAPGYKVKSLAIGTNTDPYQPVERRHEVMRSILEVLARANHPVGIVTKSALVTRDIDILAPMARKGLAKVAISVTTLDPALARSMEPRASTPARRLDAIAALSAAGIPANVLVAPIIPGLNDAEVETILARAREAGASEAGYVMLRLPLEVRDLFGEWLLKEHPDKYARVIGLIRSTRGGRDYDATFGKRQTGEGPYAWMIGRRFQIATARLGYSQTRLRLRTDLFAPTRPRNAQLQLL